MRCLDRQKQWVLVSLFEKLLPVIDADGRRTGEHRAQRSRQFPVLASVSAVKGSAENAMFGQSLDYDRTVIIDDPSFDVSESAVLWIDRGVQGPLADAGCFEKGATLDSSDGAGAGGSEPSAWTEEPHDYVVKKVGRSDNYTILAVKRVEVSK